ncbi:hypothetical protein FF125_02685 [Aureibaculum algae]|uniref:Uncharacterized protein n=1 Tax=Aureibaculum algae TaxID=2584122 RepID=A0A5B7TQE0_9FLAO|nr:hypothetical protein [Aureibaculum algae]QCX37393.1 hypothetical protein FF125_02685 [Aureibaculum algae]
MSYSNMKPTNVEVHKELKKWVAKGGMLIYVSHDDDPYQSVSEWWNNGDNKYKWPSEHLFKSLDIDENVDDGVYQCGKGQIYIIRKNPKEFVIEKENDTSYLKTINIVYKKANMNKDLEFKNNLYLERGPFKIVSVLDESVSNKSCEIMGPVIDLFDPTLPVLSKKIIVPGEQGFLYDLTKNKKKLPQVIASDSQISNEITTKNNYTFTFKSPKNTNNVMRIQLPKKPSEINLFDVNQKFITSFKKEWDTETNTLWLPFNNSFEGVNVNLKW